MFENINTSFLPVAAGAFALIYMLYRCWRLKVWINVSAPGKMLHTIGLLDEGENKDLVEMKLTGSNSDRPAARVKTNDEDNCETWVLNGDPEDDTCMTDYRMCGYITPEGLIYKQRIKSSEPVLAGYVAHTDKPDKPTVRGKRTWRSLWLDSDLSVFEGNPSDFNPEKPLSNRVGHIHLSGIVFQNRKPVTLEAKAAAAALFYRKYGYKSEKDNAYRDVSYSWGDTALLTSIIYSVLFMILYFIYTCILKRPLLGDNLGAAAILTGFYFVLWFIILQIKIECIERSHSFQPQLDMLNKSVGIRFFDKVTLSLCGLAALYTLSYYDFDLLPLISAISFGITKNNLSAKTRRQWKIVTDYSSEQDREEDEISADTFASTAPPAGEMVRTYDWQLDSSSGKKLHGNITVQFSMDEYNRMRQENPYFSQQSGKSRFECISNMLRKMKTDNSYTERLRYIARYIRNEATHAMLDEMDTMQFALDFVQEPNIELVQSRYSKSIQFATEYVRFPDETLYDQEGDSGCKSLLAAMILHTLGYNVLFLSSGKKQHSAIAIELKSNPWLTGFLKNGAPADDATLEMNGRTYIYCETTGDGYRVGDLVDDMRTDDFDTRIEILNESDSENTEEKI